MSSQAMLPRMDFKPTSSKMIRASPPMRLASIFVDLFSGVGQRPPPPPPPSDDAKNKKEQHIRLISIAVSNYVEKVRWGLDLLESNPKSPIYYTEDLHAPAFAAFQTVPASNDQASQSPMVVIPQQKQQLNNNATRALWGSDAILRELCSDPQTVNLYPKEIEKDVKQMEDDLAVRLGATARCFGYSCLLDKSKQYYGVASKFLTLGCPKIEQLAFDKMLDKGLAKGMLHLMKVEECGETSEHEIRKVFDEMSKRLEENGGDYLMDTSQQQKYGFTAADLSLCALSYFLIRPPEMEPFLLPESELPPRLLQLGKELCQTTAGKHVLKMYQKHRPVDSDSGEIALKTVNQNRIPWVGVAGTATVLGGVVYGLM